MNRPDTLMTDSEMELANKSPLGETEYIAAWTSIREQEKKTLKLIGGILDMRVVLPSPNHLSERFVIQLTGYELLALKDGKFTTSLLADSPA